MLADTDVATKRITHERAVLQTLDARWDEYYRTLRHADQAVLDRLMDHARAHASASRAYADARKGQYPQHLERAALVSILIEQQAHIDDLEDRLDHLEADLNDER